MVRRLFDFAEYVLTSDIVVKNEGPDFYVEVEKVPVPETGMPVLLQPRCSFLDTTAAPVS